MLKIPNTYNVFYKLQIVIWVNVGISLHIWDFGIL